MRVAGAIVLEPLATAIHRARHTFGLGRAWLGAGRIFVPLPKRCYAYAQPRRSQDRGVDRHESRGELLVREELQHIAPRLLTEGRQRLPRLFSDVQEVPQIRLELQPPRVLCFATDASLHSASKPPEHNRQLQVMVVGLRRPSLRPPKPAKHHLLLRRQDPPVTQDRLA